MHQDSLELAAIQFTLERLQESARRSGHFLPAFGCDGKLMDSENLLEFVLHTLLENCTKSIWKVVIKPTTITAISWLPPWISQIFSPSMF